MEDEKIIELFWQRDEQALYEAQHSYGGYCRQVAGSILPDSQDAEEVVADTWLQAWESIPPWKPKNLKLYLAKITRNLAFSRYRSQSAAKRGSGAVDVALEELGGCIPSPSRAESRFEAKELEKAINAFLETVSPMSRKIFIRRYFFLEELPQIARRYRLQETTVRMRLSRTRRELKKYLIQEGYDL